MLIDNVDALKLWLAKYLTPICDADPQTLSKYVVALVKKDKPIDELKELCNKELEVFLSETHLIDQWGLIHRLTILHDRPVQYISGTERFVEKLFTALDNKSYIPIGVANLKVLTPGTGSSSTTTGRPSQKHLPLSSSLNNGKVKTEPVDISDSIAEKLPDVGRMRSDDLRRRRTSSTEEEDRHVAARSGVQRLDKRARSSSRDRRGRGGTSGGRDANHSERKENRLNRSSDRGSRERRNAAYDAARSGDGGRFKGVGRDERRGVVGYERGGGREVRDDHHGGRDRDRRLRSGSREGRRRVARSGSRNRSIDRGVARRGRGAVDVGFGSDRKPSVTDLDLRNRLRVSKSRSSSRPRSTAARVPIQSRLGRKQNSPGPSRDRGIRRDDLERGARSSRSRSRIRSLSARRSRSILSPRLSPSSHQESTARGERGLRSSSHTKGAGVRSPSAEQTVSRIKVGQSKSRSGSPRRSVQLPPGTSPTPPTTTTASIAKDAPLRTTGGSAVDSMSPSSDEDDTVDERKYRITIPLDMTHRAVKGKRRPPAPRGSSPPRPLILSTAGGSGVVRYVPHPSQSVVDVNHVPQLTPAVPAPVITRPPRCRDYDEKGFCLRGDLCTFDHGLDPLVVDDVNMATFSPANSAAPVIQRQPAGQLIGPGVAANQPRQQIQLISAHRFAAMQAAGGVVQEVGPLPPSAQPVLPQAPVVQQQQQQYQQHFIRPDLHTRDFMPPNYQQLPGTHVVGEGGAYVLPLPTSIAQPPRYDVNMPPTTTPAGFPHGSEERRIIVDFNSQLDAGFDITNRLGFDRSRLGGRLVQPAAPVAKPAAADDAVGTATLKITDIPASLNKIEHINQHFSMFGKIVNLQVCYGGAPDQALVTYATVGEANSAFYSSEPVLSNRFIRILRHNVTDSSVPQQQQQSAIAIQMPTGRRLTAKERLGLPAGQQTSNTVSPQQRELIVATSTGSITKTLFNANATTQKTPAELRHGKVINKPAAARAAASKDLVTRRQMELNKQKQLLLQKQVEQQKVLLAKLSSTTLSAKEREYILKLIKTLDRNAEMLKQDLCKPVNVKSMTSFTAGSVKTSSVSSYAVTRRLRTPSRPDVATDPSTIIDPMSKSLPQTLPATSDARLELAKKTILDAELDLIVQENGGADTTELAKQVSIMKMRAMSQGLFSRGRGRGFMPRMGSVWRGGGLSISRRGSRGGALFSIGRGRGSVRGGRVYKNNGARLIDRRSRRLLVTGFTAAEASDVLQHLRKFGRVENSARTDESKDKTTGGGGTTGDVGLLVDFGTRREAETAATDGARFNDKKLTMTWCKAVSTSTASSNKTTVVPAPSAAGSATSLTAATEPVENSSKGIVRKPEEEGEGEGRGVEEGEEDSETDEDDHELIVGGDSVMLHDDDYDEDALLKEEEEEDEEEGSISS